MTRSLGHIAFVPDTRGGFWEYFERDGHIWRMGSGAPVMPDGYRCGRWYGPARDSVREQLLRVAA